jgi:hypothetical protein
VIALRRLANATLQNRQNAENAPSGSFAKLGNLRKLRQDFRLKN